MNLNYHKTLANHWIKLILTPQHGFIYTAMQNNQWPQKKPFSKHCKGMLIPVINAIFYSKGMLGFLLYFRSNLNGLKIGECNIGLESLKQFLEKYIWKQKFQFLIGIPPEPLIAISASIQILMECQWNFYQNVPSPKK